MDFIRDIGQFFVAVWLQLLIWFGVGPNLQSSGCVGAMISTSMSRFAAPPAQPAHPLDSFSLNTAGPLKPGDNLVAVVTDTSQSPDATARCIIYSTSDTWPREYHKLFDDGAHGDGKPGDSTWAAELDWETGYAGKQEIFIQVFLDYGTGYEKDFGPQKTVSIQQSSQPNAGNPKSADAAVKDPGQ